MATMATMVSFEKYSAEEKCLFVFRVNGSDELLYVDNFEDGIVTFQSPSEEEELVIKASTISGCFEEESNFVSELCKVFCDQSDEPLKAIRLKSYSGKVTLEITRQQSA